jgi:hypothetical protein
MPAVSGHALGAGGGGETGYHGRHSPPTVRSALSLCLRKLSRLTTDHRYMPTGIKFAIDVGAIYKFHK